MVPPCVAAAAPRVDDPWAEDCFGAALPAMPPVSRALADIRRNVRLSIVTLDFGLERGGRGEICGSHGKIPYLGLV